jgi:hypothetical protein
MNKGSKNWIWFFVVLAILTVAGITLETWFNLAQQLKPEQLADARRRWHENGPRNYAMTYSIKDRGNEIEKRIVQVQGGRAQSAAEDGRPLRPEDCRFACMEALFDYLESRLEEDRRPGSPQAFVTARLSSADGHLIRYVRSVRRTSERLEITLTLRPLPETIDP